jgi:hypothetical protein
MATRSDYQGAAPYSQVPADYGTRTLAEANASSVSHTMVTDWATITLVAGATWAVSSNFVQMPYALLLTAVAGVWAYSSVDPQVRQVQTGPESPAALPNSAVRATGGATRHPSSGIGAAI